STGSSARPARTSSCRPPAPRTATSDHHTSAAPSRHRVRDAQQNDTHKHDPASTHLQVSLRETCGAPQAGAVMKFTVTPLGGARSEIAQVVEGIVRYLQPPPTTPLRPVGGPQPTQGGPSEYYADAGEEPGRWLG